MLLLNAQGDTLWTRRVAGPTNDVFRTVSLANDGNFMLTGTLNTQPQWLKVNAAGQTVAQASLAFNPGGIGVGYPGAAFADVTGRGGYWVTLYNDTPGPFKFVHLTEAGVRDQDVTRQFSSGGYDYVDQVQPLPGGAGYLGSVNGRLGHFTPTLDTLWTRNYRGSSRLVRLLPDGNAVTAGNFSTSGGTRVYLAKVAPATGQLLRDTILASLSGASQLVGGLALEPGTGNYVFTGFTTRTPQLNQSALFFGLQRRWTVTSQREARARTLPLAAWPNPVGQERRLTLRTARPLRGELLLRDELGRLVRRWPAQAGATAAGQELSLAGLPAGLYLLAATDADGQPYVARVLCQ